MGEIKTKDPEDDGGQRDHLSHHTGGGQHIGIVDQPAGAAAQGDHADKAWVGAAVGQGGGQLCDNGQDALKTRPGEQRGGGEQDAEDRLPRPGAFSPFGAVQKKQVPRAAKHAHRSPRVCAQKHILDGEHKLI